MGRETEGPAHAAHSRGPEVPGWGLLSGGRVQVEIPPDNPPSSRGLRLTVCVVGSRDLLMLLSP